ncbi:hypothetical protein [Paenarthrobacter sp. Y-19]|uniref:hypothetical protein n=1 Tax=Paenarthrobacter sp. Y-19 TaxID=3031125 RepID=UPI0023D98F36|nr:hypothetical protein [Paenarthrobacter sp. Y-19]
MEDDLFVWTLIWESLLDSFAAARVADEILWMNGATWAQLWSGIFGAVAGAGGAAWVATFVLGRTVREQNRLAADNERVQRELASTAAKAQAELASNQLTEQREALERQLVEQRAGLDRQLAEQKAGLELQLAEQREEAKKARQISAVADLLAAASELRPAHFSGPKAILDLQHRATSAALRLHVEDFGAIGLTEIILWPAHLADLARDAHHVSGTKAEKIAFDTLNAASSYFVTWAGVWVNASPEMRQEVVNNLSSKRKETEPKKEWFAEMWADHE